MTSLLNSIKQVLNEEKQNLEEKSVSQAQQKLMGMAYALKKGEMEEKDASPEVKKLANSMSMKDLKDFASTKHDEIPMKKEGVNEGFDIKDNLWYVYSKKHDSHHGPFKDIDKARRYWKEFLKEFDPDGSDSVIASGKDLKRFMKKYDPSLFKEAVEIDARRKSFKQTMKRIEGYKAKKKAKMESTEYEDFFRAALKKFGVKSPDELEGDKEKKFYDYVDANWEAKNESVIEKVNKIVNEKRKQRAKCMNEVDEPNSKNEKDLVDLHRKNVKVVSDI